MHRGNGGYDNFFVEFYIVHLSVDFYRLQGKVMFSQACDILSTIGLMTTGSLLGLAKAQSARILLECFLVLKTFILSTLSENYYGGMSRAIEFSNVFYVGSVLIITDRSPS